VNGDDESAIDGDSDQNRAGRQSGSERGQARKEGRVSGDQNQLFLCFSLSFFAMLAKFSASASMAAALFSIWLSFSPRSSARRLFSLAI